MQKSSTKTLYSYWNMLRGSRSAPERREIDPTRIRAALPHTFVLELNESGEFDFRLAGSHICALYARELKGRSFSRLWHPRDRDAMETLLRAVTEDHAVALVTMQGTTAVSTGLQAETVLLPVRHNGNTTTRMLGAMTALDEPYWFGTQPVTEQRITGLRLIWPDDSSRDDITGDAAAPFSTIGWATADVAEDLSAPAPMAATVYGRAARRYAHLAVIDGGRE